MTLLTWTAVVLLGGLGATARFLVDWLVSLRLGFHFPYGTLVVNLSGAFLLGLLAGAAVAGDARLLAGTATIGSYTTFSTWMLETRELDQRGNRRAAAINIVGSLALGLAAAGLGHALGAQL
ncbi:MAG TPA: fluoride efflux transporter CrcB [Solirubrobacterales bacterium]